MGWTEAAPRVLGALLLALGVNLALFMVMEAMVRPAQLALERGTLATVVDFVRLKREPEPPPAKRREPPPREAPEKPPERPEIDRPEPPQRAQPPRPRLPIPALDLPAGLTGGPVIPDFEPAAPAAPAVVEAGLLQPKVRIQPRYPPRAQRRGISGTVTVQFTVTPDGRVAEARVVSSEPPNVFDQAALQAIGHWRFPAQPEGSLPRVARQTFNFNLAGGR